MKHITITLALLFTGLTINAHATTSASDTVHATNTITLNTPANSGKIINDTIYLLEAENGSFAGNLKPITLTELNASKAANLTRTGEASTTTAAKGVYTKVIGGSATGGGSGLATTTITYDANNVGTYVYNNPAPKWMSNLLIGACNNPTTINGVASCPTDNYGFMIGDSEHFFEFFCGGTLINEAWVMTAAHCLSGLEDGNGNPLTVAFASVQVDDEAYGTDSEGRKVYASGSGVIRDDQQYRDYADMYAVHPSYNSADVSQGNDIALLRLTNPLYDGTRDVPVTPVTLTTTASTASTFAVGDVQTVYGWGVTDSTLNVDTVTSSDLSTILMEGTVPFVSLDTTKKQIWSGADGQDTCTGDSGGPLLNAAGTQVGITSYGTTQFCGTGEAASYTDVGAFYTWLRTTMNANAKATTSCISGYDCYVNGTLISADTGTDTGTGTDTSTGTDTGTSTNTGSTTTDSGSSGGGSFGVVELIALAGMASVARYRRAKTK
ncbi:MAG: trypsin-like serine protease [Tolumonas sp.]|nr:trypsin-like serine protease [Tolumonas sp.]